MTTEELQEREQTYGPLARYSDRKPGETVVFREDGIAHTGEILWVCQPREVAGKHLPLQYVVITSEVSTFPTFVLQGQIIEGGSDEPTLMDCRYCRGRHYLGEIERCPLRPNR